MADWGDYYLILLPDNGWIGRPNQSKSDYKVVLGKWLFQSESGGKFKIINDSVDLFTNQIVKKWTFGKDSIRFNTFDKLTILGKEIIISH